MTFAFLSAVVAHLWQSTLFAFAAALLVFLLRKNQARIRYGIWFAASLKFLVPFSLLIAFGNQFTWRTAPVAGHQSAPVLIAESEQPLPYTSQSVAPPTSGISLSSALILIWFAGALITASVWIIRWRRVHRTVRRAVPVDVGCELETLRRLEARIGIAKPVELRLSGGLLEPGVFGILRPLLVLPAGIGCHLSRPQLESVIVHEISHIRRYDNLTGSIQMLVETLFWFHPLVWWLSARLVDERERACDEEVMKLVGEPQEYAEGILRVCELYLQSPVLAVSGVTGSDLKRRVRAIMAQPAARALTVTRKIALATAGFAAIAGPLALGVWTAPPAYAQAPTPLAFEVVSVRMNNSGEERPGPAWYRPGGLFSAKNVTLKSLILAAYRIPASRLSGGSAWMESDKFDVEARAKSGMFPARQYFREETNKLDAMVRTLLAERFNLRIRQELREVPVYTLVVAKGGPKMQPASKDRNCFVAVADFDSACHSLGGGPMAGLTAQSVDMDDVADVLSNFSFANRPVFNRTGLQGLFDFYLKWTPDSARTAAGQLQFTEKGVKVDPNGPDLLEAMEQQLGLRLENQKGSVGFYVIEGAEKPSEN